jgi:Hypothetical methyltransferase
MMQKKILQDFFSADHWQQSIERFPLSGFSLVDQVNALNPKVVVDVGCGFNPFKGKIKNLIGFDFSNRFADIVCDIDDAPFARESVDVVLALGSINFGDRSQIIQQISTVMEWLRPNGKLFMRANPGEPIGHGINVFPWSTDVVVEIGEATGLRLNGCVREEHVTLTNEQKARRLFWIYCK